MAYFFQYRKLSLAVLFHACLPLLLPGASFEGFGDLTGGDFNSEARGISADGSVVVGQSESSLGLEGFRWTEAGGLTGLGDLAGGDFRSAAWGVSGDGSVVVGEGFSASGIEAFRWTEAGGLTGLGDLNGGDFKSGATGISSDGSVIVGGSASGSATAFETFSWTQAGGRFSGGSGSAEESVVVGLSVSIAGLEAFSWTVEMAGLGDLNGVSFFSQANGISADGSAAVGRSESNLGMEAFLFTEAGGMVGLGDLAGGSFFSQANGVSADGSVVVGRSESATGIEAFRWTEGGGMAGLGDLAGGGYFSEAFGVSADGSVVVGWSTPVSGVDALEAFIWEAGLGMSDLKSVLEIELGLDLTGWTLIQASAVSDDGLKIAGWGINPSGQREAWVADLTTVGSPGCVDVFCGEDIPGFPGWKASPWYLNYNVDFMPWIFHDEHSWQFLFGGSTEEVIFLWDLGLGEWLFFNENTYRWMYLYGLGEGWIFTFSSNTPESRFFQRLDAGSLFSVPPGLPTE